VLKDIFTHTYPDMQNVRQHKTTEAQEGYSFEELIARETTRKIERIVEKEFGKKIRSDEERPWPGAFAIVDEKVVILWLKMLESNGLHRFSDRITIDWFTKAVAVKNGMIEAHKAPIASEPAFRFPRNPCDLTSVMFRITVMDPQFLDPETKTSLYKELPKEYIVSILNTLNPDVLYQIFGKEFPEMLKRAGSFAQPFDQLLKLIADKWKGKATPSDYSTLQDYLHMGLIHEMVHALALHVPDEIPMDIPQENQEQQRAISFDRYLEIINNDQRIQTGTIFFKNLIKALQKMHKETPSTETQSNIINALALEMMCDRFSMYLYENFLKTRIYNTYLFESVGYAINTDMLLVMEQARKENKLAIRHEVSRMEESKFKQMVQELMASERDHVFIRQFEEPAITSAEWSYYTGLLTYLKHLDKENQIMRFTMQHANTSRFMHISVAGMTQNTGIIFTR
jgi:hypothetical protein